MKVVEQPILETVSKHMEDRKVSESSHDGFMKGKSCLTKVLALDDEVTRLVDEGRATKGNLIDFSKAFDIVFHGILHLVKFV